MGQYYKACIIRGEYAQAFSNNIIGADGEEQWNGAKLTEHSWLRNPYVNAVAAELYHNPGKLAWVGDYANDCFDKKEEPELYKAYLTTHRNGIDPYFGADSYTINIKNANGEQVEDKDPCFWKLKDINYFLKDSDRQILRGSPNLSDVQIEVQFYKDGEDTSFHTIKGRLNDTYYAPAECQVISVDSYNIGDSVRVSDMAGIIESIENGTYVIAAAKIKDLSYSSKPKQQMITCSKEDIMGLYLDNNEILASIKGNPPKMLSETDFSMRSKFIVNHTSKEYIDVDKYTEYSSDAEGWTLHPLSLMTAIGNGQGGGDYFSSVHSEDVGAWKMAEISIEDEAPEGYKEKVTYFKDFSDLDGVCNEGKDRIDNLMKAINEMEIGATYPVMMKSIIPQSESVKDIEVRLTLSETSGAETYSINAYLPLSEYKNGCLDKDRFIGSVDDILKENLKQTLTDIMYGTCMVRDDVGEISLCAAISHKSVEALKESIKKE